MKTLITVATLASTPGDGLTCFLSGCSPPLLLDHPPPLPPLLREEMTSRAPTLAAVSSSSKLLPAVSGLFGNRRRQGH